MTIHTFIAKNSEQALRRILRLREFDPNARDMLEIAFR